MNYKERERIQIEGYQAGDNGLKETDCPYPEESEEAAEWRTGYADWLSCNDLGE